MAEVGGTGDLRAPALSPDGSRIALRQRENDGVNLDLWVIEQARGTTTRFTFDPGDDGNPVWSPDGSRIAWSAARDGWNGLMVKSANGVGAEERVAELGSGSAPTQWSQDGRHVVYQIFTPKTLYDVGIVDMTGDRKAQMLLQTPFNESRASLSPDSKWLVYESDESGRAEIYVASFEGASGKWQVSTRGGTDPVWSRDGRELFFLGADQRLMTVPIAPGDAFNPGTPQPLFRIVTEASRRRNVYCPSPDGQRFLFLVPVGESTTPMTVMVNWRTHEAGK
jgi:Tol biopolymer transport system component